jgi:hypothetical protein
MFNLKNLICFCSIFPIFVRFSFQRILIFVSFVENMVGKNEQKRVFVRFSQNFFYFVFC